MKNLLLASAAMLLTLTFCKNTPLPEGQTVVSDNPSVAAGNGPAVQLPMGKLDTMAGIQGCEVATWSPLTANSEEFIYQHYTVKIVNNQDQPGQQITVVRDSGRADFIVPMPENGYFNGVCRNKMFVDAGTGPDGRMLFVYDLDRMSQFFQTPYCGDMKILHDDRLYFMVPVDEKEVTKMPDCPEKEQWQKDGLRVGYGQRCIFNFVIRTLTRKSEWACVPMQ